MAPKKARPRRLWPLLFLPPVGMWAGLYLSNSPSRWPANIAGRDPMTSAAMGLLAGCGAMVICAGIVLIYRIARRRFTIANILVAIVIIALLLACIRALAGVG
jgi:hypothetical protein